MKVNKGIFTFCSRRIYISPNPFLLRATFLYFHPSLLYLAFCALPHLYPRWRGDVWMRARARPSVGSPTCFLSSSNVSLGGQNIIENSDPNITFGDQNVTLGAQNNIANCEVRANVWDKSVTNSFGSWLMMFHSGSQKTFTVWIVECLVEDLLGGSFESSFKPSQWPCGCMYCTLLWPYIWLCDWLYLWR